MIGKLLRLAALVVASLSIGTVLAQALGLGYCWSQGWLEQSRLERWLAVAQGKARIVMPDEEKKKEETPDRLQAVALVEDQVNVELPPADTLVGLALSATLGSSAATVTVVD